MLNLVGDGYEKSSYGFFYGSSFSSCWWIKEIKLDGVYVVVVRWVGFVLVFGDIRDLIFILR